MVVLGTPHPSPATPTWIVKSSRPPFVLYSTAIAPSPLGSLPAARNHPPFGAIATDRTAWSRWAPDLDAKTFLTRPEVSVRRSHHEGTITRSQHEGTITARRNDQRDAAHAMRHCGDGVGESERRNVEIELMSKSLHREGLSERLLHPGGEIE